MPGVVPTAAGTKTTPLPPLVTNGDAPNAKGWNGCTNGVDVSTGGLPFEKLYHDEGLVAGAAGVVCETYMEPEQQGHQRKQAFEKNSTPVIPDGLTDSAAAAAQSKFLAKSPVAIAVATTAFGTEGDIIAGKSQLKNCTRVRLTWEPCG